MENKIKRDPALINLVADFELKFEKGEIGYLDEKVFLQLIGYYEDEYLLDKALEIVEYAIEQFKYRSDFYIIKSRLLLHLNQPSKCLEILETAESIAPFEREISLLRVRALSLNKDFAAAQEIIDELREGSTRGENVDLLLAQSYIYENLKDYDSMYESLARAATLDSSNEEVLERVWISVELSRRYEDSVKLHFDIVESDPYNYQAWYNLGHGYNCIWEYEKAIEALEYSFIINPDFESGYLDCADTCMETRNFEKALEVYSEANKRFGPNNELMVSIAHCNIHLNRTSVAKQWLIKSIRIDNFNDEAYYFLAECYAKEGVWYNAINAYHKAIEIEDRREEYYHGLAKAYLTIEDYKKALLNFKLATETGPEESIYWREYVCFLMKLGQFEEAENVLDEAEDHTYGTDLLYCRAALNYLQGDIEECCDLLTEALEENYSEHPFIFELAPEMKLHKEINSMIKYYADDIL